MTPDSFGIIVIGDEILNGRRRDRHFEALGNMLRERGFGVAWLRILPDDPEYLVNELAATMAEGRAVFCCGGIGATPDDHTRACAARAAGVDLELHPEAAAEIEGRFGDEAHPHRIRMAELPRGSEIIPNPYNRIPGFSINRHYFMPGFPDMAHPMAAWVLDNRYGAGGSYEQQRSVLVRGVSESVLLDLMQELIVKFPEARLFSLPRLGEEFQVELGFRGVGNLQIPFEALTRGLTKLNVRYDLQDG